MGAASASGRPSVLVVDDEPTIGEIVGRYLQRAGYETRIARDGPHAIAMSLQRRPDIVVLDVMLPGIDGLEVMRILREQGASPPVILLTAKGEESDRIVGLNRGADDYVVKPFSPAELLARVQAVLRRSAAAQDAPAREAALEHGPLRIEAETRTVTLAGRQLSLTHREFDLLAFLARHPGRVFSRDRLMEAVWPSPSYGDSSTVTVHIRRLRAKIEPQPRRPRFIQTVWGVGYRFRP